MAGAPEGNQNARKGRVWAQAIERALARRAKSDQIAAIDELAEKLLTLCDAGDLQALKEFGDRVEGKPAQAITGEGGGPVVHRIELVALDDGKG